MSLTRKETSYSFFGGATLGLAGYAATYYVSPAIIGAANFAAANFFAGLLGTTAGAILGIGSIAVAVAVISGLITLALYAAYQQYNSKSVPVPVPNSEKDDAATDTAAANPSLQK